MVPAWSKDSPHAYREQGTSILAVGSDGARERDVVEPTAAQAGKHAAATAMRVLAPALKARHQPVP